jgi:hypothetical protein
MFSYFSRNRPVGTAISQENVNIVQLQLQLEVCRVRGANLEASQHALSSHFALFRLTLSNFALTIFRLLESP